jgi:ABC-2 type transport system ATP-binding protein
MATDGCAVVVATHELDEAERIADDIVVINRGHTVLAGTLNEIRKGRAAIQFGSDDTIDLTKLSTTIGKSVKRQSPGKYRIDADGDAELIGKLGSWLAANGHPLRDVNTSGETLAEIFTRVVGDDNQ